MSSTEPAGGRARSLVVRVWLPDRPGALGQVASRIGALQGDVTAIDILERGGGRVIDELVVSLPVAAGEQLLAREIAAVDGVAVEHIRAIADERLPGSAGAVLELAASVADAAAPDRLARLVSGLRTELEGEWAAVVSDGAVTHHVGRPPETAWLLAFLTGSGHLDADASEEAPGDIAWACLHAHRLQVAVGRASRTIHAHERERVRLVARIVDALPLT